jgi:hypothetical protein
MVLTISIFRKDLQFGRDSKAFSKALWYELKSCICVSAGMLNNLRVNEFWTRFDHYFPLCVRFSLIFNTPKSYVHQASTLDWVFLKRHFSGMASF